MQFLKKIQYSLLVVLFCLCPANVLAQSTTGISGIVVDAETGELLPFVQVFFMQSNQDNAKSTAIGTTSNLQGEFEISNTQGYTVLRFQMVGYKTHQIILKKGQLQENEKVLLSPSVYALQDVVVKPKVKKERYRRKNNPAVELIRNVIARKDSATIKNNDYYTADTYTRMSFALDNFTPNFKKGLWKKLNFIQQYIDTMGEYPSITLSIRENLANGTQKDGVIKTPS
jgi:hypothetical protein